MSFANTEKPTSNFEPKKKTEYMQVKAGAHLIRILEESALDFWTHYLGRVSVKCLEENCPICKQNQEIIMHYPETFREMDGYRPRVRRYYVNVLDKTPAKVCTKCETEYKNLGKDVCECGEVLPQASPLNKVKVLSKGVSVFGDLEDINNAIKDNNGEVVGLNHYDITLMVSGSGRDTKVTCIPDPSKNEPVSEGLELFDLSGVLIELEPDEMLKLQSGVSLKDIFTARKVELEVDEPVVSEEVAEQIKSKVDQLFNQD